MESVLKIIKYMIIKILNILVGIPLAFALTLLVLSICLVDLLLLSLPVFLICDIVFQDIAVTVIQNSLGLKFVVTILGTIMGYCLQKLLKIYVPKWFKGVNMYLNKIL
ncbi:hypothetical protein FDC50_05295 [Clostridium botulinum]|uniref:hypothetical protein n=1 Tax=Clostridium sp. ZS1 TaxID=2949989 RepID=UPI0005023F01|nr:hypothetical protein [Clostridium sp. ZS1]KFX57197.1 hypothetical protein KU41_12380 [Clostridium botulinum]MBN1068630.1 hypothetical protein [Clostridium botulinum]MBY6802480.1 hypothetical protein [Clostridium botulinum]MBY6812617.1 hypothetical protein [Clostridium botulinum]MBY6819275.1 hypothetical protein [Clostridium botulinum]